VQNLRKIGKENAPFRTSRDGQDGMSNTFHGNIAKNNGGDHADFAN